MLVPMVVNRIHATHLVQMVLVLTSHEFKLGTKLFLRQTISAQCYKHYIVPLERGDKMLYI